MERLTYTVGEVVGLLGISRCKTYELLSKGTIPSFRLDGRIMVPRKALEDLINAKTSGIRTPERDPVSATRMEG